MKIKQRQDIEVKFKLKGEIITGVVEMRSHKLEYNIKNNEYRTIPVRVGNIIYIVLKEMVVGIVDDSNIIKKRNELIKKIKNKKEK